MLTLSEHIDKIHGYIIINIREIGGIEMDILRIIKAENNPVVDYAAEELVKYLDIMTEGKYKLHVSKINDTFTDNNNTLYVGLTETLRPVIDFGLENEELDDAVYINVNGGNGVITGSNFRSVLLAVYRFLYELGCRWVRPGKDGELIVKKELNDVNVSICEKASLRHRGIVIEGANSYENVRDIIEWMPKVGFNSYFIQFKEAYTFFKNWYTHVNNELKEPEDFSIEDARAITRRLEYDIKKRGLLYHAVGHGWTCECLGIPGLGWDPEQHTLPSEQQQYLALVNGKRDFWYNVPINTNLCYSNPEVRELMANHVVEYAESHSNIDYLHVWLADAYNCHCECPNCVEHTPTDLYIKLLNLIDEKMTAKGLDTKIVFLLYFELLWPPEKETIANPDRFVLMFAPISRTFEHSYNELNAVPAILPYVRNKIKLPNDIGENIAYLKEWQKVFKGDSFDFDYPLGRAHYGDPGYYDISRIISNDIKSLKNIGLNGYLSCQEQRAFMPTGLPNYVMGLTLWNSSLSFEDIVDDYFKSAFGPSWEKCKKYLSELSNLFSVDYWLAKKKWIDTEVEAATKKIPELIDSFGDTIEENIALENPCWKKSWKYLKWHSEYTKLFSRLLCEKATGDKAGISKVWSEFKKFLQETEDCVQSVYDVYRFIQIAERGLELK